MKHITSKQKTQKFGALKTITRQKEPEQDAAPDRNAETQYVRAEVVAKVLDVHKRTVCLWAQKGKIPSVGTDGTVRFDLKAVLEALARKKFKSRMSP